MSSHAFNRFRQQQEPAHVSAVFVAHLGRCFLESVPDAAAREELVDRTCVLLSAGDAAALRQVAGIPPDAPDPGQSVLSLTLGR